MTTEPDPRAVAEMQAFDALPEHFRREVERTGVKARDVVHEIFRLTRLYGYEEATTKVSRALERKRPV
jgi:hypothetical protein